MAEAQEQVEQAERIQHAAGSNKKIALVIVVMALPLAFSATLGKSAQTEAMNLNIQDRSSDDHCPPLLRDRQSHHAERSVAGLHDLWRRGRESGADQSAEQPDSESLGLQLRFRAATRAGGRHFERVDLIASQTPVLISQSRIFQARLVSAAALPGVTGVMSITR
jgi:hypothetical protein